MCSDIEINEVLCERRRKAMQVGFRGSKHGYQCQPLEMPADRCEPNPSSGASLAARDYCQGNTQLSAQFSATSTPSFTKC